MARPKTVNTPLVTADVAVDAGSITNAQMLDVTATVKGLRKDYPVIVWAQALTAHVGITNAHCSAKDTVKFRLINATGAPINPDSLTFRVVQF